MFGVIIHKKHLSYTKDDPIDDLIPLPPESWANIPFCSLLLQLICSMVMMLYLIIYGYYLYNRK